MPYSHERVPHLAKTDYGHAGILRAIVSRSIDYAHLHNKGFDTEVRENFSRPLRRFFDDILAKFPNWLGRESGDVLLPEQYDGAMRLRRQCSLACRHARAYPESASAIKTFFTLVPDYIQQVIKDPEVPNSEYKAVFRAPAPDYVLFESPADSNKFPLYPTVTRGGDPLDDVGPVVVRWTRDNGRSGTTERPTSRESVFAYGSIMQPTDKWLDLTFQYAAPTGPVSAHLRLYTKGNVPVQPPTNTAKPAITGTAKVGVELTCSNGTWTGSPTFKYQWKAGGTNIAGATTNKYTPVAGDVGKTLTCTVTGTNAGGTLAATSAATAAVVAADPPPEG